MKLLFLTPQLPYPPHQGTTIRNYNLIRELAARHEIHLFSFATDALSEEQKAGLAFCRAIHTWPAPTRSMRARTLSTLISAKPDMALRLESAAAHQKLAALLREERFAAIQVEGIEMAPYLLQTAQDTRESVLVFDDHNAEYILQRRAFETDRSIPRRWLGALYSFAQWQKLCRYERDTCLRADHVIAVSSADAQALQQLAPSLQPCVIPNGVDLDYYQGASAHPPLPHAPALVFTGKMDFRPNVDAVLWFSQMVLPLIRRQMPAAHFYIVGQSPHRRLSVLSQDSQITLTGYVPDTRPYIAGAEVYVIPLRIGGGTRLKVLEAMAMSKAIVSTTLGCEGIGLRDGQEAWLADTPAAFAERVLELLRAPEKRRVAGHQARRFVETHYDWRAIAPRLESLYAALRER